MFLNGPIRRSLPIPKPIVFNDFRLGLNTTVHAASISPKELSICVNLKILPLGSLETREGLTQYTSSALANPATHIAYFPFEADIGNVRLFEDTDDRVWEDESDREWQTEVPPSSGADELIVTQPGNILYYLSDTKAPVEITTLEGEATIIPFGDKALICDGSYLKYWDKTTNAVKLAYDDGSGSHGYQYDDTDLTEDTQIKLYSGGNTKAGIAFTTQSWDSGYTISITMIEAVARRVGTPSGNVGAELYTSAGALVATSTTTVDSSTIEATPELLEFEFSGGAMSPSTIYWAVITFSGDPLAAEKVTDEVFEDVTTAAAKGVDGITKANPGVVTFDAGHGYSDGDVIYFSGLTEMTELNGEYWVLRNNAGDTFELQTTVGSSLDTSGYGAAEVTGGNCAQKCDFTSWTEGAAWYVAVDGAGALTNKANAVASDADIEQDVSAVAAETYRVVYTISSRSAGSVTVQVGGVNGTERSTNDTFTEEITATGTGNLKFQASGFTGQIDTISVKKVANYVQLECDTVASSGDGKYYDNASSWQDDATKMGLVAIKPGRPPRGQFGLIKSSRIFVAGDPSNRGVMWYCDVNNIFDWSTSNAGGYIGAIDDNVANYPIGAIVMIYGDIYVFGQQSQPYICKLTGDSPSDYALPQLFQRVYSTHKTALNVINDIWFGANKGVNTISGVEQYGDLRTFSESEAINDRIKSYWEDSLAFAGYNGAGGQFFLKLPNYSRCLVAHTKAPVPDRRGRIRYPWTEYLFVKEELSSSTYKWTTSGSGTNEYYVELTGGGDPSLTEPCDLLLSDSIVTNGILGSLNDHEWDYGDNDTLGYSTIYIRDNSGDPDTTGIKIFTVMEPTAFASYQNEFFIAFDDGYIYTLDRDVIADNSVLIPCVAAPKMLESPFNDVCIDDYDVSCGTLTSGVTFDLELHSQAIAIDELHSATPDASFTIDVDTQTNGGVNGNFKKLLPVIRNIDPNGEALKINNIQLTASSLSK